MTGTLRTTCISHIFYIPQREVFFSLLTLILPASIVCYQYSLTYCASIFPFNSIFFWVESVMRHFFEDKLNTSLLLDNKYVLWLERLAPN